jgi:hypothetical protein
MPDPLLGLNPSELCSYRVAVRRLRRRSPHDVGPRSLPSRNARAARPHPKALPNHRAVRFEPAAEATFPSWSVRSRKTEVLSKPDVPPVPPRPKPLWSEWLGSPRRCRSTDEAERAAPLAVGPTEAGLLAKPNADACHSKGRNPLSSLAKTEIFSSCRQGRSLGGSSRRS